MLSWLFGPTMPDTTNATVAAICSPPAASSSWLPSTLLELLSMLRSSYQSDGLRGALLAVPTSVFTAIGRVPEVVFNLNAVAFAISVGLLLLMTPILLVNAFRSVAALSSVGPARKTLSILLISLLWWSVPLLGTVLLALFWAVMGLLVVMFITLLPLFISISFLCMFLPAMSEFVDNERRKARNAPPAEDISFAELGLALVAAACSLCTVAPLVVGAAMLKAPLVFLGVVVSARNIAKWLWQGLGGGESVWPILFWLPFFVVAMTFVVVVIALGIVLSALVKFVAAIYWPAYVACGWLRTVSSRRQHRNVGTIVVEAAKAAYQVLWFSDIITNCAIRRDPARASNAAEQMVALAKGERQELSAEVRAVSLLPPVVIGVLQPGEGGAWHVDLERVAREINVPVDKLRVAWEGFFQQMKLMGERCIERDLLSAEYAGELPPPLLIGLPSLVLLQLVARSPPGEDALVLADGMRVDRRTRPRGAFADQAWARLIEAKKAVEAAKQAKVLPNGLQQLEAVLLAGGADATELPPALAAAAATELPPALSAVHRPLYDVVYKMAQQRMFKDHFQQRVYEPLSGYTQPTLCTPPTPQGGLTELL